MKTTTLIFCILLTTNHYANAKGCRQEINISVNHTSVFSCRCTIANENELLNPGDTLQLSLTSFGDCSSSGYCNLSVIRLFRNGAFIDSSYNYFKITDTGTYTCTAHYEDCSFSGDFNITVNLLRSVTAVPELSSAGYFITYPQPAKENISVNVPNLISLTFYNLSGSKVFQIYSPGTLIDVSELPSGYYLMSAITRDEKKIFGRIIKQ
jgi:hypothetical protein